MGWPDLCSALRGEFLPRKRSGKVPSSAACLAQLRPIPAAEFIPASGEPDHCTDRNIQLSARDGSRFDCCICGKPGEVDRGIATCHEHSCDWRSSPATAARKRSDFGGTIEIARIAPPTETPFASLAGDFGQIRGRSWRRASQTIFRWFRLGDARNAPSTFESECCTMTIA